MHTAQPIPVVKPKIIIALISLLAVFQTMRVFALPIIQGVFGGQFSDAWLFPAMTDVVIGVSAIFVAYALWRMRGLAVWTVAIVWFVISISDHLDAITVIANTTEALPPGFPPSAASAITMLSVMSAIEIGALITLIGLKLRTYYLEH